MARDARMNPTMKRRPTLFCTSLVALVCGCSDPSTSFSVELTDVESFAATNRTSEIVTEIQHFNASLDAASRSEKYALMKQSPFVFYRGTDHLYWKDFGRSSALLAYGGVSTTRVFLGGDMHVNNTGAFDDDHNDLVFGLNDFDESIVADYQLDVWRLATSLVLVARDNGGFSSTDEATIVDAFTEGYLDTMAAFAGNDSEMTRKFDATNTYGLLDEFLADVAASQSRATLLSEWTILVNGVRRLATTTNSDLAAVSSAVASDISAKIAAYRSTLTGGGTSLPASHFAVKSVAARLHAGVGSLGMRRYYVLIEGASTAQSDDRILDVKAVGFPAAWSYAAAQDVDLTNSICGGNMALRSVMAQKSLGYRADDYLGWMSLADGQSYAVRERSARRGSFPVADLTTITQITKMAEQWGQVLAAHHARADRDWNVSVFPMSLDGTINGWVNGDHAGFRANVRSVAIPYANQVEMDYASFCSNF